MKKIIIGLALAVAALVIGPAAALAQAISIVPNCGAPPRVLSSGDRGRLTVDQAGNLCAAIAPYPSGFAPVKTTATGTTAATAAAMAAVVGKTNYICGFSITSLATAATSGTATITGTLTATMSFVQGVGAAPAVASLTQTFQPCIPASAANTAITVNSIAAGTAGVTAVNVWGFRL